MNKVKILPQEDDLEYEINNFISTNNYKLLTVQYVKDGYKDCAVIVYDDLKGNGND